jgi:hypothetical protein
MYSEELQRSHAPSEPCDPPRSALTKPVKTVSMEIWPFINSLVV